MNSIYHESPVVTSGIKRNGDKTKHGGVSLTPHATELLAERDGPKPVWIRSPKHGTEPYTGLTRAKLYQLAGEGRIETRCLRETGRIRGVRLFSLQSVLAYIDRCPKGMKQEGGSK